MKKIILLFIILPNLLLAQDTKPKGDFYLEDNAIIYRHVYKDSLDSASVIAQKLIAQFPVSPNLNNVKEFKKGLIITGNYETQNGTEGYPWELLKAYFCIEIKNGKYRVTLSNILDNPNAGTVPLTSIYAKNNPAEWRSGIDPKLAKLDAKLTNAFKLNPASGKSDW
jgi:hypothetical protein